MVTIEESTSVMDAVRSSSKTRSSKLTSAKKTVDPGMSLPYVEYVHCTHTYNYVITNLSMVIMVTIEESTSVMDAVRSSSKTRSSKLTSVKKTVDPGMSLPCVEYVHTLIIMLLQI